MRWTCLEIRSITNLKHNFFCATLESVLMYSATMWTLTRTLECKLDGTYTRLLRGILYFVEILSRLIAAL